MFNRKPFTQINPCHFTEGCPVSLECFVELPRNFEARLEKRGVGWGLIRTDERERERERERDFLRTIVL